MDQENKYKLYSIPQAARLLGIGKSTLYRLIDSGKIGTIPSIGKQPKIPNIELERFIQENTVRRDKIAESDITALDVERHLERRESDINIFLNKLKEEFN